MPYPYEFQIALTLNNLVHLPRRNIAWPDSWTFQPWAVTEIRGDGVRVGFGFPRATWNYDNMGQAMLHRFLNFFSSDTDVSISLFIRTYQDTGVIVAPANFACLMHRPVDGQGKELHARVLASRAAYSGVTFEFTRLVEQ